MPVVTKRSETGMVLMIVLVFALLLVGSVATLLRQAVVDNAITREDGQLLLPLPALLLLMPTRMRPLLLTDGDQTNAGRCTIWSTAAVRSATIRSRKAS